MMDEKQFTFKMPKMLCEPVYNLPIHFDINSLQKESQQKEDKQEAEEQIALNKPEKKSTYEVQSGYRILPTFLHQQEHLKSVLSLKENEYLSCKWNQFLDLRPDKYVRLYLYKDYKLRGICKTVRKMQLNGNFYGPDYKLAPIPYLPDPRR